MGLYDSCIKCSHIYAPSGRMWYAAVWSSSCWIHPALWCNSSGSQKLNLYRIYIGGMSELYTLESGLCKHNRHGCGTQLLSITWHFCDPVLSFLKEEVSCLIMCCAMIELHCMQHKSLKPSQLPSSLHHSLYFCLSLVSSICSFLDLSLIPTEMPPSPFPRHPSIYLFIFPVWGH